MKTTNQIRLKKNIIIFLFTLFFIYPSILKAQQHGDLIRIQGEEKIYLIQNGQRRAIANEEVFRQMGFKIEDVKELDAQTVYNIPEGPPLWSKEIISPYPEGTLIRLKGKAQTYIIKGGRKCFIPDPETFQVLGLQWDQVVEVEQNTFNKIPTGIPLPSVKLRYYYGQPGPPQTGPPPIGGSGMPPYYPYQPYPPSSIPPSPSYPPPQSNPPPTPPPLYQYPTPSGQQPPIILPPTYPSTPSNPPSYPNQPNSPSSFFLPAAYPSFADSFINNFQGGYV